MPKTDDGGFLLDDRPIVDYEAKAKMLIAKSQTKKGMKKSTDGKQTNSRNSKKKS